jgi:hypothetical protein
MPITFKTLPRVLLLSALAASIAGCASNDQDLDVAVRDSQVTTPGVAGGVQTSTVTLNAEISAIDPVKRSVTLRDANGHQRTIKVGPQAVNFDQVKVGDQVTVQLVEELAIFVVDKNATAPAGGAAAVVAGAEPGSMPAGLVAATVEVVGTVTAIDLQEHSATLSFPDGSSKVVKVRKDVALNQNMVGREVVFRLTEAVAMRVERR